MAHYAHQSCTNAWRFIGRDGNRVAGRNPCLLCLAPHLPNPVSPLTHGTCLMHHILTTAAPIPLDFDNLSLEAIDIDAIMHQLAHECRWAGNVYNFYSVLQHSCFVAQNIKHPALRIYGFVHDFAEAFTRDLPTPFKHWLVIQGADVLALERKILNLVYKRLKLKKPTAQIARIVDEADKRAWATEVRDIVKNPPALQGTQPLPFGQLIKPQVPLVALEKAKPIFDACMQQYREAS